MTDTPELPPLPAPLPAMEWQHHMYTADQLRAYAAEAVRVARQQALEDAARTCEERSGTMSMFASSRDWRDHDRAINGCASAIRALKDHT